MSREQAPAIDVLRLGVPWNDDDPITVHVPYVAPADLEVQDRRPSLLPNGTRDVVAEYLFNSGWTPTINGLWEDFDSPTVHPKTIALVVQAHRHALAAVQHAQRTGEV